MRPSSTQQFSGIFVSYRRDDSSGHAGRLADRLVEHFGRNRIFMDIDTIEPGEDFVTVIENAVGSCEILIAVIGAKWLSASGSGRLDNPNNFVRLEIGTALRRDIRVIPVLVQRASMPKTQDLPEDLVKLTRRNAVELSDLRWQSDVDQLISVMERVLAKRAEAQQLAEANHSDEEQRHQGVEENRRVDEQLLVAENTRLPEHRRNVEAEQERGQIEEVDRRKAAEITQRSEEDETAEKGHVGEAPVGKSIFAARENRLDAPATIVTAGTASPPAYKQRLFMLIAGASLIVLLAATILVWRSQRDHNSSPNTNQAPTPQPSLVTEPTPAKPTSTLALTPSSTPDPVAFSEPTLWKRDDTGTIVQIVRNGNTLRARVVSASGTAAAAGRSEGDLAFEGTYEGKTIKGTAYLLFSTTDVSRCPAFRGEQPWDLELTLSADGNTLRGSRENYELSADCNIIMLRRKKLTYTKILR
jgi:TIR domain-containing protein